MPNFNVWWTQICQLPQNDGNPPTYGWTFPTWGDARKNAGYTDVSQATFNAMTQEEAGQLAESFFWNRRGGLWLKPGLDVVVVDWIWNSGDAAGLYIQTNLLDSSVKADSVVGPETSQAINDYGPEHMTATVLTQLRTQFLLEAGFTKAAMPGLFNRAELCLTVAHSLIGSIGRGPSA